MAIFLIISNHCHIIISEAVNCLYDKGLTNEVQQIRNKNSYNYVNLQEGNESKYKKPAYVAKWGLKRSL